MTEGNVIVLKEWSCCECCKGHEAFTYAYKDEDGNYYCYDGNEPSEHYWLAHPREHMEAQRDEADRYPSYPY